jgi:hypothetical protein
MNRDLTQLWLDSAFASMGVQRSGDVLLDLAICCQWARAGRIVPQQEFFDDFAILCQDPKAKPTDTPITETTSDIRNDPAVKERLKVMAGKAP